VDNDSYFTGVILTHGNIISNLSSFIDVLNAFTPQTIAFSEDNQVVLISYLPLSHMMEQMCHWCGIIVGARIGYFRGNLQLLTDDMKALRPTIFPVVPRLLNRFYDIMQTKLAEASTVSRWLFQLARNRKLAEMRAGIVRNDSIWDRLVFSRLQREIGGRVQYMMTGSAPIRAEVLETCRAALGAIIIECKLFFVAHRVSQKYMQIYFDRIFVTFFMFKLISSFTFLVLCNKMTSTVSSMILNVIRVD
jgi:long-chain acyl-CoA synthetase